MSAEPRKFDHVEAPDSLKNGDNLAGRVNLANPEDSKRIADMRSSNDGQNDISAKGFPPGHADKDGVAFGGAGAAGHLDGTRSKPSDGATAAANETKPHEGGAKGGAGGGAEKSPAGGGGGGGGGGGRGMDASPAKTSPDLAAAIGELQSLMGLLGSGSDRFASALTSNDLAVVTSSIQQALQQSSQKH